MLYTRSLASSTFVRISSSVLNGLHTHKRCPRSYMCDASTGTSRRRLTPSKSLLENFTNCLNRPPACISCQQPGYLLYKHSTSLFSQLRTRRVLALRSAQTPGLDEKEVLSIYQLHTACGVKLKTKECLKNNK